MGARRFLYDRRGITQTSYTAFPVNTGGGVTEFATRIYGAPINVNLGESYYLEIYTSLDNVALSPSPSASPTPTVTPTSTATPTPVVTATPTPAVTPIPTPSPTSSRTLRLTPAPGPLAVDVSSVTIRTAGSGASSSAIVYVRINYNGTVNASTNCGASASVAPPSATLGGGTSSATFTISGGNTPNFGTRRRWRREPVMGTVRSALK